MVRIQVIGSLAREGAEAGKRRVQRHEQTTKKGDVADEGADTVKNGDKDGRGSSCGRWAGSREGEEVKRERGESKPRRGKVRSPDPPRHRPNNPRHRRPRPPRRPQLLPSYSFMLIHCLRAPCRTRVSLMHQPGHRGRARKTHFSR